MHLDAFNPRVKTRLTLKNLKKIWVKWISTRFKTIYPFLESFDSYDCHLTHVFLRFLWVIWLLTLGLNASRCI